MSILTKDLNVNWGTVIAVIGAGLMAVGVTMDTTVQTIGLNRVHNIGLMKEQQNMIIIGAVVFIGGLIIRSKSAKPKY